MYCKHCGAELNEGSAFCKSCGKKAAEKSRKGLVAAVIVLSALCAVLAVLNLLLFTGVIASNKNKLEAASDALSDKVHDIGEIIDAVQSWNDPFAPKAPTVEEAADRDAYYVTVYAREGTVLIYETADGKRMESTVQAKGFIKYNVPVGALVPPGAVPGAIIEVTPKVYVKNADGSETRVKDMPSITITVPGAAE